MLTKISYCSLDGDPAVLAYHSDGRILGFKHLAGKWKNAHAADISMEAANIGENSFMARWPGLALPDLGK